MIGLSNRWIAFAFESIGRSLLFDVFVMAAEGRLLTSDIRVIRV